MKNTPEYKFISAYYENEKTKRSNVPLINHIDEGLIILDMISASDNAKRAYCFHPVLQSDENLELMYSKIPSNISNVIVALTMEYRYIANSYLSLRTISNISEIKLSPLKDVNDMLIADKVQNRKDFELYHLGTHPRSSELDTYFKRWLLKLNIDENTYQEYKNILINR